MFVRFVGGNRWSGDEQDRQRDAERTGADAPLWCNTDFAREGSQAYAAEELAPVMREGGVRFCVHTGGEPLLQVDAALVHALHTAGFQVATETKGTVALRDACWDENLEQISAPGSIVCSPKLPQDRLVHVGGSL